MARRQQEGLDPETIVELRLIKYVSLKEAKKIRESAIKKAWIVRFIKNTKDINTS